MLLAREFLLLGGLGFIVAGLTTYLITWILVSVHLRDHHKHERARIGAFLFTPRALGWYLWRRYRAVGDRRLTPIARMGSIGAWTMICGIVALFLSQALGWS